MKKKTKKAPPPLPPSPLEKKKKKKKKPPESHNYTLGLVSFVGLCPFALMVFRFVCTGMSRPGCCLTLIRSISPSGHFAGEREWLSGYSSGLVIERSRVRVAAGAAREFFSGGHLSVLTLISVSVSTPCYRSSTSKILVILPKVQVARVCMWLCMKWRDMAHGCMVYTKRTETSAVSRGTRHVTTEQRCKYNTWVTIENKSYKKHKRAVSLLESGG